MIDNFEDKAKDLANQPYSVDILRDKTTTGEDVFLAKNPDLPGCMAQGTTIEEAINNLADARLEYIQSLLEDGEPVPEVASSVARTGVSTDSLLLEDAREIGEINVDFLQDLDKAIQPVTRETILRIESVTP